MKQFLKANQALLMNIPFFGIVSHNLSQNQNDAIFVKFCEKPSLLNLKGFSLVLHIWTMLQIFKKSVLVSGNGWEVTVSTLSRRNAQNGME
jgi:hypothetical protein